MTETLTGSTIITNNKDTPNTTAIFFMGTFHGHHGGRFRRAGLLLEAVLFFGTGKQMDTITQLQQNRRIIHDFTSATLASLPGSFARLAYIASLRDLSSNTYEHPGLAAVYRPEAVQQALEQCHEEIFERILETPLAIQEEELRAYLKTMPAGLRKVAAHWRKLEAYRALLPAESPDYLKELFCSNIRAMLEILEKEAATAPSGE